MLTEREISTIADDVFRQTLGDHGFDHSKVSFGDDHDGVPSIFVEAVFRKGAEVTPGKATITSISALANALLDRGDSRFPYFQPRFVDDEIGVDH